MLEVAGAFSVDPVYSLAIMVSLQARHRAKHFTDVLAHFAAEKLKV